MTNSISFRSPKKQGEWVELQFLARATSQGFTVSKPWGDSTPYDCVVESNRSFHRIQVKSRATMVGHVYQCGINGPAHGKYPHYQPGDLDFFAIYLIPEDLWYIIPAVDVQGKSSVGINPRNRKNPYIRYLEAWHLLRGAPGASTRPAPARSAQSDAGD